VILLSILCGDLVFLPALRVRTDRSLDREIAAVWRAYAQGWISLADAERLDGELRQARARTVVPYRPRAT